jgi:lipoate-protein ligase A
MIAHPKRFKLIEYARLDGSSNMALDRRLLEICEGDPEVGLLRFYTWARPTLSMGHLEPQDAIDMAAARRDGVAIVRRPTGGRVVLHGDDLTYTVVLARSESAGLQETYNLISEVIVDGLSSVGARLDVERGRTGGAIFARKPCFASASRYEVTHGGRKVVGSAQRVGDRAFLQHGSIPLGRGYLGVADYMNVPAADRAGLRQEMVATTSCLSEVLGRRVAGEEIAGALAAAFQRRFRCDWNHLSIGDTGADNRSRGRAGTGASQGATPIDKSP